MKVLDVMLWAIVLVLCGAIAFAPRERTPSAQKTAPDAAAASESPPTGAIPTVRVAPGRSARALDPQTVDRYLEVARDVDPALAESLERIRAERPAEAFAVALADKHFLRSLVALKEEDPMLYSFRIDELRMEAKIDHLLDELAVARRAHAPSTAELQEQLPALVEQQMAYSLLARAQYVRRLNQHVQSLRDKIASDSGNFKQAVKDRVKELLDQVDRANDDAPGF